MDPAGGLPDRLRSTLGWVAAIAGVFTFVWLPFGTLDLGFRLDPEFTAPTPGDGVVVAVFAAVIVVPVAWTLHVAVLAEHATLVRRWPIPAGLIGGVALAVLATGNDLVLFSGQQGIRALGQSSSGELIYLVVAKAVALVVLMLAGWRGGPIFPLYLSTAALAVVILQPLGVGVEIAAATGMVAVSTVFVKGRVALAVVFTLYAVPAAYAATLLVAAGGAAVGLLVAGTVGLLPSSGTEADPEPATAA